MFKASRWRSEKNKIKDVFKLQFQATQVPDLGCDSLMVYLVPEGVGKPAVKSDKAAIQEGNCQWESPIYHTVRFTKESKSGKLNKKIYRIALLTGSSKGSFLGEVAINFADYVEVIEPLCLSQPIKTLNSNIVLHVTIQRIQKTAYQREVEDSGILMRRSNVRTLKSQLSDYDTDESCVTSSDIGTFNSPDDGSFRGRLQLGVSHEKTSYKNGEPDCIVRESSFSDSTSASNSILVQDTPQELGLKNKNVCQDVTSFPLSAINSPTPLQTADSLQLATDAQQRLRLNMEFSVSSAMQGSLDDFTSSFGVSLLQERLQASDISIENLKNEMAVLLRQADVSQLELQTLRKQIVKERRKGQDLSREVHSLKQERDDLRKECERLKALQQNSDSIKFSNGLRLDSKDLKSLLVEIERELDYAKDLNTNLQIQLLKTQESNSELIQTVRNLEEQLESKNMGSEEKLSGNSSLLLLQSEINQEVQDLTLPNLELPLKWKVAYLQGEMEAYKKDREELEMQLEQLALDYEILKQENHQISLKLEQSQLQEQLSVPFECSGHLASINDLEDHVQSLEKELEKRTEVSFECSGHLASIKDLETHVQRLEKELEKRIEAPFKCSGHLSSIKDLEAHVQRLEKELEKRTEVPFECSSHLASIKDLEANVQRLEKELEKRTEVPFDCSGHLASIKDLEGHVQRLEKELEKRTDAFEADLAAIGRDKVLQEQRAIQLEDELRKTRWNNFSIAERLQEEFNRLEMQMSSALDVSEKQAMQAVTEANELRLQKILQEKVLEKANEEIEVAKVQFEEKLKELLQQIDLQIKQIQKLTLNLEEKSNELENLKNSMEERERVLLEEIAILQNQMQRLDGEKIKCREEVRVAMVEIAQSIAERHSDDFNQMKHYLLKDWFEKQSPRKQGENLNETALGDTTDCSIKKVKHFSDMIGEEKVLREFNQNNPSFKDEMEKISDARYAQVGVGSSNGLKDVIDKTDNMAEPEIGAQACIADQNTNDIAPVESTDENDVEGGSKVSTSDAFQYNEDNKPPVQMVLLKENKCIEFELNQLQGCSEMNLNFGTIEGKPERLVITAACPINETLT